MTGYEYECAAGHYTGSPTPMSRCPAFVRGEQCPAELTSLDAVRVIRPSRPPARLYLCDRCLESHKVQHNLPAAEVKRLGLSSRTHTCDSCQSERAAASVPNPMRLAS